MKRQLLLLIALTVALAGVSIETANADGGHRGHGGHGRGGRGIGGLGFAVGGGYDGGWDIAELYRQLYNNLPYFALHPPVYYSYPVPRTYGYSPFAYLPDVMTPDVAFCPEPATIVNPYVPSSQQTTPKADATPTAATVQQPQPLVVINPYVTSNKAVAQADR